MNIMVSTAQHLDPTDPIFESLRVDYPDFDLWFTNVQVECRPCLAVADDKGVLYAVAILKRETSAPYGITGSVGKLCTFKVSGSARGSQLGEALLDGFCAHAQNLGITTLYTEVFEHHTGLANLLQAHGFVPLTHSARGELVFTKQFASYTSSTRT